MMVKPLITVFCMCVFYFCGCCPEIEDDLDIIKQFKPDDKYFKAGLVSLHFLKETSSISKVDSVFERAIAGYGLPISAQGCKDGEYTGTAPYDAYDYMPVIKITVKDEKIVAVDYNEVKKNGIGKQEDEVYGEAMSVAGTTPANAYPILENQLLKKQDLSKINAVSGATYSLYRFKYAVIVALIKAQL